MASTAIWKVPKLVAEKTDFEGEVMSFQFGIPRSNIGVSVNKGTGSPNVHEFVVTRLMDKYSPLIFQEAAIGKERPMTIYLRDGNAKTVKTYMTYEFEGCMVSGYHVSSSGDKPTESISVKFSKMTYKYEP